MFSYILSVAIAFIVFGTAHNILMNVSKKWKREFGQGGIIGWVLVGICSAAWFFTLPILIIGVMMYLLKILTDKITQIILNKIEKRKQSKLERENV